MKKYELEIAGKKIEFEVRGWVKRGSGEVVVKSGKTQVLVTVVMEKEETDLPYFPLMVNYEERYYARGEILGSRYVRREGRPTTNATLIARAIDRMVRPLFPKTLRKDIQIVATCLAWDGVNDPDILGMLGASFVLNNSHIPWKGPVAAVRIAQNNGRLLINPTYEEREKASLDIIFCAVEEEGEILFNMIEMEGPEVAEEVMKEAAQKAIPPLRKALSFQKKVRKEAGKEKEKVEEKSFPEIKKEVDRLVGDKLEKLLFEGEKGEEASIKKSEDLNKLREEVAEKIEEKTEEDEEREDKVAYASRLFEKKVDDLVNAKAVAGKRIDGRRLDEVRELECQARPVPSTHGSGLFSRGLTTSLSILTLGGPEEQKIIEGMEEVGKKRLLHHYNFPPYSVGEVKPFRSPGRREIGHGALGEKALRQVIPSFDDFPYTIRIVSEILTSNGSTSQSAICSSSLALMDAGVPIKRPVAGIALGLAEKGGRRKILTDIQGLEDFHGGMDFKEAGTEKGATAIQMDVKVRGIPLDLLEKSLDRAKKARLSILAEMKKEISGPRKNLAPSVPKVLKTEVPPEKIGLVIGGGGKTIKKLSEETGAEISIEDTGEIFITAPTMESARKARKRIEEITKEIEEGEEYVGQVVKAMPFGVFVRLCPGKEGLLHKSKYKRKPKRGEKIKVKVLRVDHSGKIDLGLSRKNG